MKIKVEQITGWKYAKRAALRTQGLRPITEEPTKEWKLQALISEHSPIKLVQYWIDLDDLRQWVGVHLLRHHFTLPYICSQRSDRTRNAEEEADKILSIIKDDIVNSPEFDRSKWRDYRLQGSLNDHTFVVNAQTLIDISKRRLCHAASKETYIAWVEVKSAIRMVDAEMANCMVPNCIYRGFCPEMKCCGYVLSESYNEELRQYRSLIPKAEKRLSK